MEYKIISMKATTGFLGVNVAAAAEKLTNEVRQHMALGWEPQGGLVFGGQMGAYLFQAMIKRR